MKILFLGIVFLLVSTGARANDIIKNVGSKRIQYTANASPAIVKYDRKRIDCENGKEYNSGTFYLFPFFQLRECGSLDRPPPTNSDLVSTKSGIEFLNLDESGTAIVTEIKFSGRGISKALSSGSNDLRIRQNWMLAECDGKVVNIQSVGIEDSLESVMEKFRGLNFSRYMKCSLVMVGRTTLSERVWRAIDYYDYYARFGNPKLSLLDNGDVELATGRTWVLGDDYYAPKAIYYRPNQSPSAQASDIVDGAAAKFVRILKDYGNLLFSLRNAKVTEKNAAIQNFLNVNRAGLTDNLNAIDNNIGAVSSITRLNVLVTVQQGYNYVHVMERQIVSSYPLDEIVIRP